MTIILFLVDSSASMAQRNYMGCAAIDIAKTIVQDILKLRQRDVNNRQTDRYMLFSTEEFPLCVKAGWKEGSGVFHDQLKALRPCGKFPLKQALLSALYFVNLNRAQTGVDYYGHGRFPHLQESVIIVTISDGSGVADLPSDFELRADSKHDRAPGWEYTEEAFRWDQRVFSIVLRMGARMPAEPRIAIAPPVSVEPGVIQRVCASTGGRSFTMCSHKQQSALIETLTQMIHVNGIVLRFEYPAPGIIPLHNGMREDVGPSEEKKAEMAGDKLKRALEDRPITFVLTRNRAGHWPIPEAFWPETVQNSPKLPVRKAHPMLTIGLAPVEAQVNTDFPFDKYELDAACPLSDFVRERTAAAANANVCWQVFVVNSHRTAGLGRAFGFLKTATAGTSVNLFLMPYNYPVLLKLLDEMKAEPRLRNHPEWRKKLDEYVLSCPSYYKQPLKKALMRHGLKGGLLDEPPVALYAPQLNKALASMKSIGKEEMDKLIVAIGARLSKPPRGPSYCVNVERREPVRPRPNFRIEWEEERRATLAAAKSKDPEPKKKNRGRQPIPNARAPTAVIEDDIAPDPELPEAAPVAPEHIPKMMVDLFALVDASQLRPYRTPFHIERGQLPQMLPRLRVNLEQQMRDSPIPALEGGLPGMSCKLQTAYELHSLPVSQMGKYDEYVKQLEAIGAGPLREVEHQASRENTFGNPFKRDKKSLAVDEVGEAPAAARRNHDAATSGMSKKDRRAMESGRPPRRKAGPLALDSMKRWRERRNSLSTVSDLSHTAEDLTDDLAEAEAGGTSSSTSLETDEMLADYMAALDRSSELLPSAGAAEPLANGAQNHQAAVSPTASTASGDSGVSTWGPEEEAAAEDDEVIVLDEDEPSPPPAKKAKMAETGRAATAATPAAAAATPAAAAAPAASRRPLAGGEEATLEKIRDLKGDVCRIVRTFLSDEAMFSKIDSLLAPLSLRPLIIMTRFARDEAERFKKRSLSSTLQARLTELETAASTM